MDQATPALGDLRPLRRCRRWWIACLAAIALAGVCHAPLLRGAAGLLIDDEPLPPGPACVLIQSGDRRYDIAAQMLNQHAVVGILLIEQRPARLVREGIVPTHEALAQHALADRGVPLEAVTILPGRAENEWQAARLLAQWSSQRSGTAVVVLCDRFDSRRQWRVLAAAFGADRMQTVCVRALSDRRFDERNWWKSRDGLKWVFHCAVSAGYDYWCGEQVSNAPAWDPNEYERELKSSLKLVASAQE